MGLSLMREMKETGKEQVRGERMRRKGTRLAHVKDHNQALNMFGYKYAVQACSSASLESLTTSKWQLHARKEICHFKRVRV